MAASDPIRLIDISNNNGTVDFVAVKKAGYKGVIAKLSEGVGFLDSYASRNARACRKIGLPIGFYHYARPDTMVGANDAEREATYFLDHLHLQDGDILPALDFEEPRARHLGAAYLTKWAETWLQIVGQEIGASPMFYTYPDYLKSALKTPVALSKWPLWYAAYGPNDGLPHPVTVPRGYRMVLHQFTSNGKIPRVAGRFDLNRRAGTIAALTYKQHATC